MLTLPTAHSLHSVTDHSVRSSLPEPHIQSIWPRVIPNLEIPGKRMLTNNFNELPHFSESFFPNNLPHPRERDIINTGFVMTCCDNRKVRFPVIPNQSAFINGPIVRKTVRYASHELQRQDKNTVFHNNTNHAIRNSVFQDNENRESFGNLVFTSNDNSSLHVKTLRYSTLIKEVIDNQHSVNNSGQNHNACGFPETNSKITNEGFKGIKLHNSNDEASKSSILNLPPGGNKLGHSIASILSISPGHGNCEVGKVIKDKNESNISSCADNISDDDSDDDSDILVDDDDVVCSLRSDEDEDDVLTNDCSFPFKQSNGSSMTKDIVNKGSVMENITQTSSATTTCFDYSPGILLGDRNNDNLERFKLLKAREEKDHNSKDYAYISHPKTLTHHPSEVKGKIIQKVIESTDANNRCNNIKDNVSSSPADPSIIPSSATEDLRRNIQSIASISKMSVNSSSSHVLPPIQTLCQQYHKDDINERSAFKPIRKTSTISHKLPHFLTQYQSWTERDVLPTNILPPNNTTRVNSAAIDTLCPETSPTIQNRIDFTTKESKLEGIGALRQKSSFYQSQGMPDIFLPSTRSIATELLPNTLESWMTWLRQREPASDKSNKLEDQARSRVPAPPRYHCDACSKTYSTFGGLSKHRQFHCTQHIKKEFVCKVCNRGYSSLGALKMHIRTHTLPCRCQECGKAFSRPWLLQGHQRTHTGEKPFKCNYCGRAFADRSNLRAHLQTHAEIKRYACNKCGKTFSRMSLLSKHADGSCPVNIKVK